ncbi:hypothetical protein PMKS-003968 [Pichia membranifaciens]|uniref:Serine/threonine-protein phosphatase 4 regulatory subunit 3-like central domain-containing protein n=1 Tax=Pichia membranifaciens TaxID=4926 RepID=A0A1Q2YLN6_9ASCO|nr:hypothetical protein PMKS-003968 [Pichia membranifaciens]
MNWRDFLNEKVKIKEVIKVNDSAIEEEIRKCFVLQFLKDVVLARLLDDSGLNCISTMIQNKESRILDFMQNDEYFLKELFALYGDDDYNDDEKNSEKCQKKIDGIKLINQFVLISKTQQPFQRTEFYKALITKGLMSMIKFSTREKEIESRILVTEVIVTIIEHEPGDAATDNNDDKDKYNDTDVPIANLKPTTPTPPSSTSDNKGKRALETEEKADSDAHGGMTGLHDGIGNSDKKKKMST